MANKKNNTLIILLLILLVIVLGAAYWVSTKKEKGERVVVEEIQRRTIKETVGASGKIFPETEIKISSDVSGEIVQLNVEEGDSVRAGMLLVKINPDAYVSTVERGEAGVNNAKAQLANADAGIVRNRALITQAEEEIKRIESQILNAKNIHERNEKLHSEGVISEADYDLSLSNLSGLEASLRSAQANVKSANSNLEAAIQSKNAAGFNVNSAEATLKETRTNLDRTAIYAPTDGVVSMLNVEQGERVVGTAQMSGTELMRIANLNSMEVQVDVSENDVLRVEVEDPVEIEVDAYLNRKFKGKVTQIANSASNTGSGQLTTDQVTNFVVKIRIDPSSYQELILPGKPYPFRPGMSASVDIFTQEADDILTLPIMAVTRWDTSKDKKRNQSKEDKSKDGETDNQLIKEVVYVVNADTVNRIVVQTGIQDNEYIQIKTGLKEGQTVVIAPYDAVSKKLDQGSEIKVVKEEDLYEKKKG